MEMFRWHALQSHSFAILAGLLQLSMTVHPLCPIAVTLQGYHDRFLSFETNCANASGERDGSKIKQSRGSSQRLKVKTKVKFC